MRPTAPTPIPSNIPAVLKETPRWLVWWYKQDGSKWRKVPATQGNRFADPTSPASWMTYEDAFDLYLMSGEYDGIGFAFNGDGLVGIDLDDCIVDGVLNAEALETVALIDGYCEISPSGTGLKIFTRAEGQFGYKHGDFEAYSHGRYFTVTGALLEGAEDSTIPDEPQDLNWFLQKHFKADAFTETDPESALALYKGSLEGWDLARVKEEILVHLNPEVSYGQWLPVGMALYHQFDGSDEALELWDDWSNAFGAGCSEYEDGACAIKWDTFSVNRLQGRGSVTLATLIHLAKEAKTDAKHAVIEAYKKAIAEAKDPYKIDGDLTKKASTDPLIDAKDRRLLAELMSKALKKLGHPKSAKDLANEMTKKPADYNVPFFPDIGENGPKGTIENLEAMLDALGIVTKYDVIKKRQEILIPGQTFSIDNYDEAVLACVTSHAVRYGMPTQNITGYLTTICDRNLFNPVMAWIESKPWDGVDRLPAIIATIESTMDLSFKSLLMTKWLVGAISAAADPCGVSDAGALVLQGAQGLGKTQWIKSLAPHDLDVIATGARINIDRVDDIASAVSFWLVELGELDATFRKSDVSALKAFISKNVDKLRRPYARAFSTYPRRTVFYGSVNDEAFLVDETGNRRFWTIPCTAVNWQHGIDVQQLWAQVFELFKDGYDYHLTREETALLEQSNVAFTAASPIKERLQALFKWDGSVGWTEMTASEIAAIMGITMPNKHDLVQIGKAVKELNGGVPMRQSHSRRLYKVPRHSDFEDELLE